VLRKKPTLMVKTTFEWAGIMAALLFFGSSVIILFEMVVALTRVSPGPEIVITIVLGILPIILGIAVIRIVSKNREKVDLGKRALLFIVGILALFFWAGFLLGPALAILASFLPQKNISSGN
jgi:cadmium resistance protein CadD (predicted permease)